MVRWGGFYYGYTVVAGAWLSMLVSSAALYSFSVFMPALIAEFGWTRSMASLALTLNTIIMPLQGLLAGYLVDRIGPRWTVISGGLIGGLGTACIGTVRDIWQFIALYGILVPSGIALCYWIANVSTVRRWFVRKAALMVSIAMTGSGLGMVLLVPVAHAMIGAWGWRASYLAFGAILCGGTFLGGLLLRKDPATIGVYPDGDVRSENGRKPATSGGQDDVAWPVSAVIRTPSWWFLIASQLGYSLALMGLIAHLIAFSAKDLQIPMGTAVGIFSGVFTLSAVCSRIAGGFVSDWLVRHFGATRKPVLFFCNFGSAAALLLCPLIEGTVDLMAVSAILGFSLGSGMAIFPVYLGDLFGLRNLPTLFGLMDVFASGFAAIGPVLFGFAYDTRGSYDPAFLAAGLLCIFSGITLCFVRPPAAKVFPMRIHTGEKIS